MIHVVSMAPAEPGGQPEGHGEPVGHAQHQVADGAIASEVSLGMDERHASTGPTPALCRWASAW
jgi:hypothetical protein